ncbi:hypothetical protein D3C73_619690 [compost metagenome]
MSKAKTIVKSVFIVLLIVSVGFNFYFIDQKMKERRQTTIDWGKHLIQSYYDATMFTGTIRDATEGVLKNNTTEQRLSYKYQVGIAYRFNQSIPSLIVGAEEVNGQSFKPMKYNPQGTFLEINNVLGSLASQDGPLQKDEITYLQTTHDLFEKVVELLKGYEVITSSDELALDMTKGGSWVGIVEQINNLFADAPDYLFTYRSTHSK